MLESRSATFKMLRREVPNDRRIINLPKPFKPNATSYVKSNFSRSVLDNCKRYANNLRISKAIFLGDMSVGKTSLVNRFCHEVFENNYKSTIGVDFEIEKFDILGVPFNLQIWDTAGQERFRCIASSYYRGADIIAIVFDLSSLRTQYSVLQWLNDALKVNPNRPLLFLIGTKLDSVSNSAYQVVEETAIKTAEKLDAEYWAVSARTGENVEEMFRRMAALVFERIVLKECDAFHQAVSIGSLRLEESSAKLDIKYTKKQSCMTCN